ncbi:MAG: hypothetical protein EXS35_06535 [Pedosphaera sp.]|nr:hypothetical protein [Pedosphaera sp.]
MSAPVETRTVLNSQKLYERLLALYPKAHREEYGPPMAQLFRDQSRDAWREARVRGVVVLWLRVLPDLVRTSLLEHLAALKGKKSMTDKISQVTSPGSAPLKTFFTVAAVVFLVVFGFSVLVTFLLPESFASTTRIKVERNVTDIDGLVGSRSAAATDPYFIQTEFEVIQSEVVLGRVIESLDLNTVWGKRYVGGQKLKTSETLGLLKSRMDLRPVRSSSLIEIRAYSEDKDEAARIANAVAEAYREHRRQERLQLAQGAVKALEQRFQEQQDRILKTQTELEKLRSVLEISDNEAVGSIQNLSIGRNALGKYETQLMEGSARLAEMRLSMEKLKTLGNNQLRLVLPRISPDAMLNELNSQLNLAEQGLARMKKDFAPGHPQYMQAEDLVVALNKKVDQAVAAIMTARANQVDSAEEAVTKIKKEMEDAKKFDLARAEKNRPYYDKKRELEELFGIARAFSVKLSSEKIDAAFSTSSSVEIIDRAVPGLRPVQPNKPLNLFLGACGGLLLALMIGGGAAWIVSRIRKSARGKAAAS